MSSRGDEEGGGEGNCLLQRYEIKTPGGLAHFQAEKVECKEISRKE